MVDDQAESLRFNRPPVRSVDLTLYFSPLSELRVISVIAFLSKWSDRYALINEQFALPPADPKQDQSEFFPADGGIPFPWLTFSDAETGHTLGFQNDRFSLYWEFKDGKTYDGFASLKRELFERFEMFSEGIRQAIGTGPEVVRAQCEYTNAMDDARPLDVAVKLLHGVDSLPPLISEPLAYAFRATLPPVETDGIRVEVDLNAANRDGENVLWIDSVAIRSEGTPTPDALIDSAHKQLLLGFLSAVSESQLKQWEMIS